MVMKLFSKICYLFLSIILLHETEAALAANQGTLSTRPTANNGEKWRIGYYEGGEYINYQKTLLATVAGLMELGWIESIKIPPQEGIQTKKLWQWLAVNTRSNYIRFVEDAHYSAGWDVDTREQMNSEIIKRLNQNKDIDLIIAMGTRAGQGLVNNRHHTPTIVLSTSDPVRSGIIKSSEDSGFDHVHARVDPLRYERQVRIFHTMIGFKKLGIAYDDNEAGRTYAAIDKVEKVADEADFEIVRCLTRVAGDSDFNVYLSEERYKKCFHELKTKVDAIYVTTHTGINPRSIPELVRTVISHKLPTFSQAGSEYVRYGFLFSISRANFSYEGRFHAETMAKIFNGAKPRDLDQVFEEPISISINLKTAEAIGYEPPLDVMAIADEIYYKIEKP